MAFPEKHKEPIQITPEGNRAGDRPVAYTRPEQTIFIKWGRLNQVHKHV